jgi:hypothetical protein
LAPKKSGGTLAEQQGGDRALSIGMEFGDADSTARANEGSPDMPTVGSPDTGCESGD